MSGNSIAPIRSQERVAAVADGGTSWAGGKVGYQPGGSINLVKPNLGRTSRNHTPSSVMWRDLAEAPSEHFQVMLASQTMWYERMDIGEAPPPMAASGLSIVLFLS
jgi:hypothetical protein